MNEEQINERMNQILEGYSVLPQMEKCEPPILELLNEKGDIKVTIYGFTQAGRKKIAEKTIHFTDNLEWITDLFSYPDYIGRQSKDIVLEGLKYAYFDQDGYLILYRDDPYFGSTEKYKIKEKHRDEIILKLKEKLGKKLKI